MRSVTLKRASASFLFFLFKDVFVAVLIDRLYSNSGYSPLNLFNPFNFTSTPYLSHPADIPSGPNHIPKTSPLPSFVV